MSTVNKNLSVPQSCLIEWVMNSMATGHTGTNNRIAKLVFQEMEGDDATDNPVEAIYNAACITNEAANAQAFADHVSANGSESGFQPAVWSILYYNFVQNVMNQVCWTCRRIDIARIRADEGEAIVGQSNGCDFPADYGAELGVDASTRVSIREQADNAFGRLSIVSAAMAQDLGLDTSEPLNYFAPGKYVDGTWVVTHRADDWDEALQAMGEIVVELQAKSDINEISKRRGKASSF